MSDENIFDGEQTPPVIAVTPSPPVIPDPLKELIGEGKKYASAEAALLSIPHAQTHIAKIEQENAELRQKMAEAVAVEEVYKKLIETSNQPSGVTPPAAVVDEASIASVLDRKLAERESLAIQSANISRVKDALVHKFGDKAQEVYANKAKELGVGVAFLNEVVKNSPKAAEELFGIKKEAPAAPVKGTVDTSFLNNNRSPATKQHSPLAGGDLMSAWRAAKDAVNSANKE